jgi:DNA-binding HxlR family transcriptional regulator
MKLNKVTKARPRRRYEDACGAAHALDLLGERWALLVVRELMFGPKRFSDLRADLPGISANVLTQRLEGLEAAGILVRRRLPPPASAQVYELTSWGYESEPIFQALGRWAARSPKHDPRLPLSASSLILSFRTMIDPAKAKGAGGTIGLKFGNETFRLRLSGGKVQARRGAINDADLILEGSPPVSAAAIYGGQPLATLEAQGLVRIMGDRDLASRFVTLFPLPPKAA